MIRAAVLLVSLSASQVLAQEMRRIPDALACATCEIILSPELTLGTPDGPGAIDWRGSVSFAVFDSQGGAYLRGFFATEIKAYGPDGSFEGVIGREGAGPGEFKGINGMAVGPGDSLYVFDVRTMRMSVFAKDHAFERSAPLEVKPSGVDPKLFSWDPEHFYMTSETRTVELIGLPIHRLALSGRRMQSFGSRTGVASPSEPYAGLRVIADGGQGTMWSGRVAHYWIDRITPHADVPLVQIRRESAFFPEPEREQLMASGHGSKPLPVQADIMQVDDHLWVMTWVPDPEWRAARGGLEGGHDRYDSVVEVIDLQEYQVIARSRFDEQYHQFLGSSRIGGTMYRNGLIPEYRVMRMDLVRH